MIKISNKRLIVCQNIFHLAKFGRDRKTSTSLESTSFNITDYFTKNIIASNFRYKHLKPLFGQKKETEKFKMTNFSFRQSVFISLLYKVYYNQVFQMTLKSTITVFENDNI